MSLSILVLSEENSPWLKLLSSLEGKANVVVAGDENRVKEHAAQADVLVNGVSDSLLLDLALPIARRARWIHSMWAGVEKMLSRSVAQSPLPFTNARGAFRRPLAEWTVAMMLHFSYDLRRVLRQQEAEVWLPFEAHELYGKTLGILGYGGIGSAVAERARPFGVRILAMRRRPERSAHDPLLDGTYAQDDLDELMAVSDFVLVATPLTAQTRGLVGEAQIAAMRPQGVIINVGRGPVIDEGALLRALEAGRIRGAALDVFDVEPLPKGHPFYRMQNVIVSPHTADRVDGFYQLAVDCFLENLRRFQSGEPLENVVDKEAGY